MKTTKKTEGQLNFIKFLNFAKESAKTRFEGEKGIDVRINFNKDYSIQIEIIQVKGVDLFDPSKNEVETLETKTIDSNTYNMIISTL